MSITRELNLSEFSKKPGAKIDKKLGINSSAKITIIPLVISNSKDTLPAKMLGVLIILLI
jgi:hypothetical protein